MYLERLGQVAHLLEGLEDSERERGDHESEYLKDIIDLRTVVALAIMKTDRSQDEDFAQEVLHLISEHIDIIVRESSSKIYLTTRPPTS